MILATYKYNLSKYGSGVFNNPTVVDTRPSQTHSLLGNTEATLDWVRKRIKNDLKNLWKKWTNEQTVLYVLYCTLQFISANILKTPGIHYHRPLAPKTEPSLLVSCCCLTVPWQTSNFSRKCLPIGNCLGDSLCWVFCEKFGCQWEEEEKTTRFCEEEKEVEDPSELVKDDEDAPETQSVDDDDDPEEIMGCETVGRARIGQRSDLEEIGRICRHLGRIWIICVWSLGILAEYQYLYVKERVLRGSGRIEPFSNPLTDIMKILNLVCIQARWRMIHYSPASIILLLLGNLKQCPERVWNKSELFFLSAYDTFSSWKQIQNLSYCERRFTLHEQT